MSRLIFIFFFLTLTSCALNKNSNFWNSNNNYSINENKVNSIKYDSNMSFEQFEIFIKEYAKNSNYPDINK